MPVELAANLRGRLAHLSNDLEPVGKHVPGVEGRHGSTLCSGRQGIVQVFDQAFMDAYPPQRRRRCLIEKLPVCKACARRHEAA